MNSSNGTLPSVSENTRAANEDDEDEDDEDDVRIAPRGLAHFASMLPPPPPQTDSPSTSAIQEELQLPTSFVGKKKQRKKKTKAGKPKADDTSMPVDEDDEDNEDYRGPLANAIMYAELLEMANTDNAMVSWDDLPDTLPSDLLTGWVALAPVPPGKRCLAVSYQATTDHYQGRGGASAGSSNDAGPSNQTRTRTLLHSRVKGKAFLTFPSPLPPDSILDCLLDSDWKRSGILHVVDILRWRGKDFVDCESEFR